MFPLASYVILFGSPLLVISIVVGNLLYASVEAKIEYPLYTVEDVHNREK